MNDENKKLKLYAASNNKEPILQVLKPRIEAILQNRSLASRCNILEIASGTGEHSAFFMENISSSSIHYQCTEYDTSMFGSILAWIEEVQRKTQSHYCLPPLPLDIAQWQHSTSQISFTAKTVDTIICINMIHISPWICTIQLFQFAATYLRDNNSSFLLTYGPYSINGEMVESNHAFDRSLKERNSVWGVRDLADIQKVASDVGIELAEMIAMPANNYCLIWKQTERIN